jgi:hypothetical protein
MLGFSRYAGFTMLGSHSRWDFWCWERMGMLSCIHFGLRRNRRNIWGNARSYLCCISIGIRCCRTTSSEHTPLQTSSSSVLGFSSTWLIPTRWCTTQWFSSNLRVALRSFYQMQKNSCTIREICCLWKGWIYWGWRIPLKRRYHCSMI